MSSKIVINGITRNIESPSISYETVAELTHPKRDHRGLSMTWKRPDGASGILSTGLEVRVADGMVINAMYTGNA